jgi:spore maturation protein CgeB
LAREYKEMPFVDGQHLRTWQTFTELIELVKYYLEHEDERKEIAQKGEQFVRENYTFDSMVFNLIKIYKNDRNL